MMSKYKQLWDATAPDNVSPIIVRVEDQAFIPPDPANRDRAEYDEWLAEGNTPDPPDTPGQPATREDTSDAPG
jgi:hypothetical protein